MRLQGCGRIGGNYLPATSQGLTLMNDLLKITCALASALREAREAATYTESGEVHLNNLDSVWMASAHNALAEYDAQNALTKKLADALESLRDFTDTALTGSIHEDTRAHYCAIASEALADYNQARAR